MSDCCAELLLEVRSLRGETEGLIGVRQRLERLEALVSEMENSNGPVDLSGVVSQLTQLRGEVGGLGNQIQGAEGNILSAVRSLGGEITGLLRGFLVEVQSELRAILPQLLATIERVLAEIRNLIIQLIGPIALAVAQLIQMVAVFIGGQANSDAVAAINVAKAEILSLTRLEGAQTRSLVGQTGDQIRVSIELLNALRQRVTEGFAGLSAIVNRIDATNENINGLRGEIQAIGNRFDGLEVILNSVDASLRNLTGQIQGILRALFLEAFAGFLAQIVSLLGGGNSNDETISAINVAKTELLSYLRLEGAQTRALVRESQSVIITALEYLSFLLGQVSERLGGLAGITSRIDVIARSINNLSGQINAIGNRFDGLEVILNSVMQALRDLTGQIQGALRLALLESIAGIVGQIVAALRGGNNAATDLSSVLTAINQAKADLLAQIETLKTRSAKLYAILGGTFWGAIDEPSLPDSAVTPEILIKQQRTRTYGEGNTSGEVTVRSLVELIPALMSVDYQRSGYHRFPATVPKNLTDSTDETTIIYDAASWQEWLISQIDAIAGNYPIKIKYKNAGGIEKDIEFANQSEAIAELIGLTMSLDVDTDILQELAFKGISETIKAQASSITSADYGKATALYLGYRHKEGERDLKLSVSPGATSIKEALKPSTKKLTTWEWEGGNDLQDTLQALVSAGEMTKASVFRPWDILGGELPGDRIKAEQETAENEGDSNWAQFIANVKTPPANQLDPTAPTVEIRNIAQSGEIE